MHLYHYAHTNIEKITDRHLVGLFDEIFQLRGEKIEGMVIHFLEQSFYPFPHTKKKKFEKHDFLSQYYLLQKIGKLRDTEIYKLCIDLVAIFKMGHIEYFHGTALYTFLNRAIKDEPKRKKRKL